MINIGAFLADVQEYHTTRTQHPFSRVLFNRKLCSKMVQRKTNFFGYNQVWHEPCPVMVKNSAA